MVLDIRIRADEQKKAWSDLTIVRVEENEKVFSRAKKGNRIFVSYDNENRVGRIDFPGCKEDLMEKADNAVRRVLEQSEGSVERRITFPATPLPSGEGLYVDDSVDEDSLRRIEEFRNATIPVVADEDVEVEVEFIEVPDVIIEEPELSFLGYVKLNTLRCCKEAVSWVIYMVVVSVLSFFFGGG